MSATPPHPSPHPSPHHPQAPKLAALASRCFPDITAQPDFLDLFVTRLGFLTGYHCYAYNAHYAFSAVLIFSVALVATAIATSVVHTATLYILLVITFSSWLLVNGAAYLAVDQSINEQIARRIEYLDTGKTLVE